ncbi:MAG: hypothetical protein ACOYXC_06040 [Candidatus Rifleibacteriota bacterium]
MNEKEHPAIQPSLGVFLAVFAAAVTYLLGIGPAMWVYERYPEMSGLIEKIYLPLLEYENHHYFGRFLTWYLKFWINI